MGNIKYELYITKIYINLYMKNCELRNIFRNNTEDKLQMCTGFFVNYIL